MSTVVSTEVRWRISNGLSQKGPVEYDVVRIVKSVEKLAGPFRTKRQAEKAIAAGVQELAGIEAPSGARPRLGGHGDRLPPSAPPRSWGLEVAPEGQDPPAEWVAHWRTLYFAAQHEIERLQSLLGSAPADLTGGGPRYWPTDKARALLDATRGDAA